jgi:hypothetical protein
MVLGRCVGLRVLINQAFPASGVVPDGRGAEGPLLLDKTPGEEVALSWSPSCWPEDLDYAVYTGPLGDFDAHLPGTCSTGGMTTATLAVAGDAYFLVVPHAGAREGAYGQASNGTQRPQSTSACFPQRVATCD